MKKKTQVRLLVIAVIAAVLYMMRDRITGLVNGNKVGRSGGGGGGGLFGGASPDNTTNSGLTIGPYSVPGATVSETEYVDYKPPTGSSAQVLPANCISDAFTQNGVDYCIALDNRGNEVTQVI